MPLQLKSRTAELASSQQRMIDAAARLFARSGFSGVTTKEIARTAKVSEGNIYRYFLTKRGLYAAALESELRQLQIHAESLIHVSNSRQKDAASRNPFELIVELVSAKPDAFRLLQFSALEFGEAMRPIYQRHLDGLVETATKHMHCWSQECDSPCLHPLVTILSAVATVIAFQDYYPLFSADSKTCMSLETATAAYADLCHLLVAQDRKLLRTEQNEIAATPATE